MPSTLAKSELHLWTLASSAFDYATVTERFSALLTPWEQTRRDRFFHQQGRHLYQLARVLSRVVLARYLPGLSPAALRFDEDELGKPELARAHGAPTSWLRFNLSHTRGMVALALARDGRVGVDVEPLEEAPGREGIAERFFAPEEAAHLAMLEGTARAEYFLQLWTLKEAYLKARGEGLSLPLKLARFELGPVRAHFHPDLGDHPQRWSFLEHRATSTGGETHLVAVAFEHPREAPLRTHVEDATRLLAAG